MIEHHIIIAKILKERFEAKENPKNQNQEIENDSIVETVKMEDIKEEDFSFKTANETKFKFIDDR